MYREGGPRIVLFAHRLAPRWGHRKWVAAHQPRATDVLQDKAKHVPMGLMDTAGYGARQWHVARHVARQWRGTRLVPKLPAA